MDALSKFQSGKLAVAWSGERMPEGDIGITACHFQTSGKTGRKYLASVDLVTSQGTVMSGVRVGSIIGRKLAYAYRENGANAVVGCKFRVSTKVSKSTGREYRDIEAA